MCTCRYDMLAGACDMVNSNHAHETWCHRHTLPGHGIGGPPHFRLASRAGQGRSGRSPRRRTPAPAGSPKGRGSRKRIFAPAKIGAPTRRSRSGGEARRPRLQSSWRVPAGNRIRGRPVQGRAPRQRGQAWQVGAFSDHDAMCSRRSRLPAGASRRRAHVGEGRGRPTGWRIGRGRPARAAPYSASSGGRRKAGRGEPIRACWRG
jgi:hypothetical protein